MVPRLARSAVALVLTAAFAAAPAFATGAPVDAAATATETGLAASARAEDAAIDRGILGQHAETLGAGKVSINSYELLLAGVSYGITDNVSVSATVLLPITADFPFFFLLNGKFVVFRSPSTVVSVNANLDYGSQTVNSTTFIGGTQFGTQSYTSRLYLFGGGLNVDHHLIQELAVHGSLQVNGAGGSFDKSGITVGSGALMTLTAGVTIRANQFLKLLGEFWVPATITGARGMEVPNAALFCYGVRFYGHTIAGDLAFIRPIGSDFGNGGNFVLGFPYVTFNARF